MGWNGRLSAGGADSRRLGRKPVKSAKSAEKCWFCRFGGAPQTERGVSPTPWGEVFVSWGAFRMKRGAAPVTRGATPAPRGATRQPRGASRTVGGKAPTARGAPRRVGASARGKRGAPHGAADAPHGKRDEAPGTVGLTDRSAGRRHGSTALPIGIKDFPRLLRRCARRFTACSELSMPLSI